MTTNAHALQLSRIDAVLFDTDGVVTDTARLHSDAWKRTIDEFLERRGREIGVELAPFDSTADYVRFVRGRSRREGLRAFLAARGFDLPEQNGPSAADADTVWSLAEQKDAYFRGALERGNIAPFADAVTLLRELRRHSVATGAVSAGRYGVRTLVAADVERLFDVRVDTSVFKRAELPGKPDPALFTEAVRRLGTVPWRAAVVDDSLAGVDAGLRGGFSVVVGVDRSGELAGDLYERGATVVVRDLSELMLAGHRPGPLVARP